MCTWTAWKLSLQQKTTGVSSIFTCRSPAQAQCFVDKLQVCWLIACIHTLTALKIVSRKCADKRNTFCVARHHLQTWLCLRLSKQANHTLSVSACRAAGNRGRMGAQVQGLQCFSLPVPSVCYFSQVGAELHRVTFVSSEPCPCSDKTVCHLLICCLLADL